MTFCRYCGKEIGEGSVKGITFCSKICVFSYAMELPLDKDINDTLIRYGVTRPEDSQRPSS